MQTYVAEFTGTFFLVLALGLTGDVLSSGLLFIAILYMGGNVSGAHFNPAVTIALWAAGRMKQHSVTGYISSQMAGALAGCIIVYLMAGTHLLFIPPPAGSLTQSAAIELLFGLLLCMVYLYFFRVQNRPESHLFGVVIGLSYAGILLTGEPVGGGVFNPAVATAASVIDMMVHGESLFYLPMYILAPLTGGVAAANLFSYLSGQQNRS